MSERVDKPVTGPPTVISGYVAAILRALDARGVDMARAVAAVGLDAPPLNDPMLRIALRNLRKLYEFAIAETGDPCFGLYAAQFLQVGNLHALGFSLLASNSLRDFGERLSRYFRFLSTVSKVRFVDESPYARLEFEFVFDAPPVAEDLFGLFLVRLIRQISDGRVNAVRIDLHRPSPPDGGFQHHRAFGVPVGFGNRTANIAFDRAVLDLPFTGASQEIAAHCERLVVDYLSKLDRADIVSRVTAIVIQDMPGGSVSKEQVAAKLFMSPRTLQIKLSKCGTTFVHILNETRQGLACGYMSNSGMSVTEVAYLIGYSDTSNFSRAFRRWTGLAPSDYRAKLKGTRPVTPTVEPLDLPQARRAIGRTKR